MRCSVVSKTTSIISKINGVTKKSPLARGLIRPQLRFPRPLRTALALPYLNVNCLRVPNNCRYTRSAKPLMRLANAKADQKSLFSRPLLFQSLDKMFYCPFHSHPTFKQTPTSEAAQHHIFAINLTIFQQNVVI